MNIRLAENGLFDPKFCSYYWKYIKYFVMWVKITVKNIEISLERVFIKQGLHVKNGIQVYINGRST